jgi:hypothetical protein
VGAMPPPQAEETAPNTMKTSSSIVPNIRIICNLPSHLSPQ